MRSSQKIQYLLSNRFRLVGRNDSTRKELINLFTYRLINFKPAFTLAEVLITLGIIGIVAALTIPGLIQKNQANKLKSQYLKAYSEIAQSIKLMKNDDVSLDPRTYVSGNSFYKTFYTYFKNAHLCGDSGTGVKKDNLCFYSDDTSYKTLDGRYSVSDARFDDGQFVLMDGALVMLENPYSGTDPVLWVHVDINGKTQKPNRWGIDLFTFYMNADEEIVPMGAKGTPYNTTQYCNPKGGNTYNGIACAVKAMDNSDYFKEAVKWIK